MISENKNIKRLLEGNVYCRAHEISANVDDARQK